MASKTGTSSNPSEMSVDELTGILHQMKELIEKNEPQARRAFVQNPVLTRALLEAQLKLGMFPLFPSASQLQQQPMPTNRLPHLPQAKPQPSVPVFAHQQHSQMGGIPHSGAPQQHSQPSVMSPPSLQAPQPSQSTYQINNSSEAGELGTQMGGGGRALRSGRSVPVISETERAFIERVLNVKEEELNLLPPHQKHQLSALQQLLFRNL